MFQLVVKNDIHVRSAQVVTQQLRNFDVVIQRGREECLRWMLGFKNVRTASSTLQNKNKGSSSVQTTSPQR